MTPGPPNTDDADRQDMARLAAGHDASLNELMDRHGERLFHYLLRLLRNESDAADMAQESFVRVYQHRAEFDGERRFSTWLYTIATNLARDRHRWRDRHPEVSLENENAETGHSLREHIPEPNADPSESLVVKERGDLVRQAVSTLPEDLRVPLVLSAYEEQSHAEIGTVLGCTAKAVEMKLYRARQELRKRLALVFAV